MIIIPLERAIDWRRPPVVTALLVLINVVVFFGYQQGDERRFEQAVDYYFDSPLPEIEIPLYLTELERRGDPYLSELREAAAEGAPWLLLAMQYDEAFRDALRGERLITPDDPRYPAWREAREEFDARIGARSVLRFGFVPADPRPMTFLSHAFLHGDTFHLIGNMVFLVLVGMAVELALGSRVYAAFYLLSALGAVGLFYAANVGSAIPVVGASGAISGVMGLYALLYGLRRIRFFYWFLFYFDYVRAPAYIVFLLWLGYELFNYLYTSSNVAYEAHIGGLLTGALLAFAAKRWLRTVNVEFLDAGEEQERRRSAFEHGLRLLAELKVDQAVAVFEEWHRKAPQDREVLAQLFKAASLKPGCELQHYAAGKLLTGGGTVEQSHDVFRRYLQSNGGKVRLPAEGLLSLARRFAKGGFADTAEVILAALARRRQPPAGLADAFRMVAEAWRRRGDEQRCAAWTKRADELESG